MSDTARAFVGISGYNYKNWRGAFYPADLPVRRWLEYASREFNSIELNSTFYSLKSPAVFERWAAAVPAEGFVFAIKGSRFITHNLKLARAEGALATFYASGVLALGRLTGPFLWQLPATYRFDAERLDRFMRLLPRDSRAGEALARGALTNHGAHARLRRGALVEAAARVPFRHAFEVRHPSYFHPEFYDLLRAHGFAFVPADTAGRYRFAEEVTTDFVYARLHGSRELYVSGYTDEELDGWAERVRAWLAGGRDTYVYFDNDAKVHAPHDARRLAERVSAAGGRRRT